MGDTTNTLHAALARGIDKGLRDVGAELSGCTPSMLTGHVIRELRNAGLHPASEPAFDHKDMERAADALHEAMCPCGWGVSGCRRYEPSELRRWADVVLAAAERAAAATPRPEEQR
jgi:hypothetical protein